MAVRSHTAMYRQLRDSAVASNAYSTPIADDVAVSLVDAIDAEGRPIKPKPRHALEAEKTPPLWLHGVKPITDALVTIKSRSACQAACFPFARFSEGHQESGVGLLD